MSVRMCVFYASVWITSCDIDELHYNRNTAILPRSALQSLPFPKNLNGLHVQGECDFRLFLQRCSA